jgi:hypothetical protein
MEEREGKGQGVVQMIVGRMRAVKLLDRVDRTFFQPSHCTTTLSTLTPRQKILGLLIIGIRCHGSTAGARAGGRHLQVDALMGWGCRRAEGAGILTAPPAAGGRLCRRALC